jgi:sugar lactone lactonase YvrE
MTSPLSKTTLAIILGASSWSAAPRDFPASPAFAHAAADFRQYLCDSERFGLSPEANLLDLFDTDLPSAEILRAMRRWIQQRLVALEENGERASLLLFCFVGHADFADRGTRYCLAVQTSSREDLDVSGIPVRTLLDTFTRAAPRLSQILVFDCCYAASAYQRQGPGAVVRAVEQAVNDVAPITGKGTYFLCSSGKDGESLIVSDGSYPLFSRAFLQVLRSGDPDRAEQAYLSSIQEVAELTEQMLRAMPEEDIRIPEYTSTYRQRGDIANVPLFPNLAAGTSGETQHSDAPITTRYMHSTASTSHRFIPERGQKRRRSAIRATALAVLAVVVMTCSIAFAIRQGTGLKLGPAQSTMTTSATPRLSAGIIHEFRIPTENSHPTSITVGQEGNLWFVEKTGNHVERITQGGHITEFSIPAPNSISAGITTGSDGNLWFYENGSNKIGRITPQGRITEFPAPRGSNLVGITAGPDGNLWFTAFNTNEIDRMTTAGIITRFRIPTPQSGSESICAGPDGNVWFVEDRTNKIGRITPEGHITEFPIPPPNPTSENDDDITAGPDGNLWFTESVFCNALR